MTEFDVILTDLTKSYMYINQIHLIFKNTENVFDVFKYYVGALFIWCWKKSKWKLKNAYKNQSMARMSLTSSTGSPTADNTIAMVTRPAEGTPAAPMAAAVAVRLPNTSIYM